MELKICRKAQFKRINIDGVANLRGNYHKLIDKKHEGYLRTPSIIFLILWPFLY